jgi:diguanylate cyclase (GGDEF)-like protein/PAS domain S-box-containing protein
MNFFFIRLLHVLFLLPFFIYPVSAKEEIHFGVFSYLGYEETREKYQPLVDYLNRTLDQKVILEVLTQEEMNAKIAKNELDIITTNPTHFLVIRHQYPLSGAIATMVSYSKGIQTSRLGGVIVVRQNSPIRTLSDIEGKTIATPSTKNMGGFRAQAYELFRAGINLTDKNTKIVETGGSHQEVVHDILEHKADVGFIRDGVLEGLIEKGEIRADHLRIVNEQHDTIHPYKVSTKLYPEWPIFALPHADIKNVKDFLAALLTLEPTDEAIKRAGFYGYTLPADYLEIEQLARDMRLPPFDKAPPIAVSDIWYQHQIEIIAFALFLALFILYYLRERHRKRLFESLLSSMGEGVYGVDQRGDCIWINKQALKMLGFTQHEVLGKDQHLLFHHHRPTNEFYDVHDCPIHLTLHDHEIRSVDEYFIRRDGTFFPVTLTVAPNSHGAIVIFRDITDQIKMTQELQNTQSKLKESNLALKHKNDILKELARYDGLTQIPNRRFFDEVYEKKYKDAVREKSSLAVLMIDVDYFKLYNDHYGHAKGDECLIHIAKALKNTLKRPTDMVARYGGEEFVVLLKNSDENGMLQVAQSLVDAISALKIPHELSTADDYVSISIGIALKTHIDSITKEELLKAADDALYRAKENGRNQIFRGSINQK